jgi:NADPH:quinone reductase-like Zn-dependent oxidoreductase
MARAAVVNGFVRQRLRFLPAREDRAELAAITALIEDGKLTPVLDRTYPLADTAEGCATWSEGTHAARSSSPWCEDTIA